MIQFRIIRTKFFEFEILNSSIITLIIYFYFYKSLAIYLPVTMDMTGTEREGVVH